MKYMENHEVTKMTNYDKTYFNSFDKDLKRRAKSDKKRDEQYMSEIIKNADYSKKPSKVVGVR